MIFLSGGLLEFIKLKNVDFSYKRGRPVFKNVNLAFSGFGCTAITGPNGSGKTTMGKLMTGIIEPLQGSVLLEGTDIKNFTPGQTGKKIGYLFQNPDLQLFTLNVRDELSFAYRFMGYGDDGIEREVDGMLGLFQLSHLQDRIPFSLSRGERQRLALASLMMNKPGYLILDEPTTGLDRPGKKILLDILRSQIKDGTGVSVISHDNDFIKALDCRIIRIDDGKIVEKNA
jgi:energy-coupling factor transport system ATP-binding protein